jgi:O-antigen/teichoic acid export membrane protein
MTLIVGTAFTPATAAVFNTYRTISRLAIQTTSIFSHSLWAEFSRLFGSGQLLALKSFYRKSELIGFAISLTSASIIFLIAPLLLHFWSHDKVAFDPEVFVIFCLATLLGSLAHVPRGLLMSTNQHVLLANVYVALAALGAGVSIALGNKMGLSGAVLASLISDAGLLAASWLLANVLLKSFISNSKVG